MSRRLPLFIAGIFFCLIALLNLTRILNLWEVTVNGHVIHMSFSVGGFIVATLLAIWMFIAAK